MLYAVVYVCFCILFMSIRGAVSYAAHCKDVYNQSNIVVIYHCVFLTVLWRE
uniref:Uncharacterized protein n=1 Tax=Anguilla anguilla TaxID=7936 RepID=A0A0E9UWH8_ANGAN